MKLLKIVIAAVCFIFSLSAAYQQKGDEFWNNLPQDLKRSEEILKADKSEEGALDYALFLFVFKSKDSQSEIEKLLAPLIEKVRKKDEFAFDILEGKDLKFDGSEESMIKAIRIAGLCIEPYYVIPCLFVKKKSILIKATEPQFGGNRDNFLPRCGGHKCGKGFVKDFPFDEVEKFLKLFSKPSDEHDGSIRFADSKQRDVIYACMIFNPKELPKMTKKIPDKIEKSSEFKKALTVLQKYYQKEFNMKKKDLAKRALVSLLN